MDVIEGSEEAVRGEVQHALIAARRHPANRAWANNGVERVVGQAVAVFGFVEMRHGDTVNANVQAGCHLLAKPLCAWVLKRAFGHDGQDIQLCLVVGFDLAQAFSQVVFARGLCNQAKLVHQ